MSDRADPAEPVVLVERTSWGVRLLLNRPAKLNALNAQVLEDLRAVVAQLRENEDIHAVILTGAGEKAFAAGADIGELAILTDSEHGVDFSRSGPRQN